MFLHYKNLKIYLATIAFILGGFVFHNTLNAQISPLSSHYFRNEVIQNPAFAGKNESLNLIAGYRNQWTQLTGAPKSFYFNSDIYVSKINSGVGLGIWSEKIGAQSINSIKLSYAYIQPIGKIKLSIGLQAGAVISKLDGSKLITPNGEYDNGINHNDPLLPIGNANSFRPDLGLGIAIQNATFNAGIAYSNLIDLSDKFNGDSGTISPNYDSPLNVYGSARILVGNNFSILPSILLKTDFKNIQTEITAMAAWKESFFLGISARGYNKNSFESLIPIIGGKVWKEMAIFYSYDVNLNKLNITNNGTHEISLGYSLPTKQFIKGAKVINNPRFL